LTCDSGSIDGSKASNYSGPTSFLNYVGCSETEA